MSPDNRLMWQALARGLHALARTVTDALEHVESVSDLPPPPAPPPAEELGEVAPPIAIRKLTDRQRAILSFIESDIRDRGFPPTLREICERFNITSTNGVNDHLLALERKGYIKRADGALSRGIRVLRSAS